jgi:hypothetical protein
VQDRGAETYSDGKVVDAVAYALGSNGGYTLRNEYNYKTPQMVSQILPTQSRFVDDNIRPREPVEEVPSITNYYDGSNRLNSVKVQCKIYRNMNDCLHQAGCGWCGATSGCIGGNQMGPLEPCSKSTYVFTTGSIAPTQTEEERVVRENIGALSMTMVSKSNL